MPTINRLHTRKPYTKRVKTSKTKQIYDYVYNTTTWRSLRQSQLQRQPLCEICLSHGRTTPAECVHHRIEISTAETVEEMQRIGFDSDNLVSLCRECHEKLHADSHRKNTFDFSEINTLY